MKMKQTFLSILFLLGITAFVNASDGKDIKTIRENVVTELEAAASEGVNTILVITDKTADNLDQAIELAETTANMDENTMVAVVDRNLEDNSSIVEKYNMTRYPVPFVLILSPAGNVTGGAMPAQISAEKLAKYIPSPCYNQALEARNDKKSTLIIVSSKETDGMEKWESVIEESKTAITPEPAIISVDAEDENEKSFLSRVGYRGEEVPVLIVVNNAGQVTGKFTEVPDGETLKTTVSKEIKKGCGGCKSSKSCSPKDKAKCGDK